MKRYAKLKSMHHSKVIQNQEPSGLNANKFEASKVQNAPTNKRNPTLNSLIKMVSIFTNRKQSKETKSEAVKFCVLAK